MTEDGDLLDDCARAVLARHEPDSWTHHTDDVWHFVNPVDGRLPKQGWKLHVPATPLSACVVLSRCVRVLAEHRCAFKFAKSMHQLQVLIEPNAARSAAGKFLTAYPRDDEQAVRIAAALHEATLGLPGQMILSDRRFRPNSQVFYRYGGFTPDRVLTDDGEFVPVLIDGNGTPIPDRREVGRAVPAWLRDPFQPREVVAPSAPRSVLIDDRYRVTSAIRQTNRGGVYVAADTQTGTQVILKRFRVHTAAALNQTDSRNRARAEARMLAALGPKGVSPRFLDLLTHDGDMFVVQQRLDGVPLRRYVARNLHPTGDGAMSIDPAVAVDMAAQLVDLLAEVHAIGYVLGDLSPNNVMVLPDNRLMLIDLESALRDWEVAIRLTTKSYTAPEDLARPRLIAPAPPVTSDLYSLGATLFYLTSGAHPPASSSVDIVNTMAARNPTVAELRPVLTGLLATNPAGRPSLAAVREMLRAPAPPAPVAPAPPAADELIEDMLAALRDTMTPDESWLWPPNTAGSAYDPCSAQVGAAGVLSVLNQAARAGYPVLSEVDTAARWLAKRIANGPRILPGLLFGRGGTALALFESGELLDDDGLRQAGLALARRLPNSGPIADVFQGVAGAGIALLRLWRATGQPGLLERAIACADAVLDAMSGDGDHVMWTATGDSQLAGELHWGFAHGVAGIGTFLLETGDQRYLPVVRRCASTLADAVEWDGAAAFWPGGPTADDRADAQRLTGLCNGSNGVATFLLRYHAAIGDPVAEGGDPVAGQGDLVARRDGSGVGQSGPGAWRGDLAARRGGLVAQPGGLVARRLVEGAAVAIRSANWTAHPVWCHGLASDGDFLLDCAAVLGEPRYRAWAEDTAAVIGAKAVRRNGRLLTPDENGDVLAALGNGYAGPLSFLLRLRRGGDRVLIGAPTTTEAMPLGDLRLVKGGVPE